MTLVDERPDEQPSQEHRERRMRVRAVFGKYKGMCECGWETNLLPEHSNARRGVLAHIEYMTTHPGEG